MRLYKSLKKILSVIATSALLFNSLSPSLVVLAQEVTPEPTPVDTSSPTPDATIAPTDSPTDQPTASPDATVAPTEEPTLAPSDLITPAPETSQPEVQGTTTENAQPQAPPETSAPVATSEPQTENGKLDATLLPNTTVDTSSLDQFDITYHEDGSATISTDKLDYAPTDSVLITGTGFIPNKTYTIEITSQDPPAVDFKDQVKADDKGNIIYSYQLDGNYRPNYTVYVKDGNNVVATTTFTDTNPSADLDQCANDPAPSPHTDGCSASASDWVNGNIGASKAVYLEGDTIPYRMLFDSLSIGPAHNVIIEWDTTKSSKHAIDYLQTFNTTVATANPCLGVSGCSPAVFGTFAIPADPQITGAGVTPPAGNFRLYGGTITGLSAYSYADGSGFSGDKSARITVTFTASVANPVLAWGGHIATRGDWGTGNSAVNIPGSPYHTRLIDLDGSGGNQDRSLSAEAVIFPASITIIKDAVPNDAQDFGYTTTGGLSPATFSLDDDADGTLPNTQLYSGILVTSNTGNNYTVVEGTNASWTLSFNNPVCTVTNANSGSQSGNVGTRTISINLREGENVTCTYINTRNKIVPTVTTQIHDASHAVVTTVPIGTTVHDSASVTGGFGTVTGNVTFDFFNNGTCSNSPAATSGSFALSGGAVDATTFTQGPLAVGSYSFKAHYTDDSNYLSADGSCEPLTVSKANTTVTTQVHDSNHTDITNGSVPLGTAVHDSATVGTQVNGFVIGGTVTYHFYANGTCTGEPTDQTVAVGTESTTKTSLGAGSYSYKADYSGNVNYNGSTGSCEPFTINKAQLTVDTTIHDNNHNPVTSVALGSVVHDTATVSGAVNGFSTPAVTFTFYNNGSCVDGSPVANTGADPNGGVRSADSGTLSSGSYSYKGSVAGNGNYFGDDSDCEPLSVGKADTRITTEVHDPNHTDVTNGSVPLGIAVHDSATVGDKVDGIAISGNVTYHFYTTNDCKGEHGDETVAVGAESTPQVLGAGSYSYNADYAGDSNYNGSSGSCEPFSVGKADSRVLTHVHNTNHDDITNTSVPLGSIVHDNASVLGQVNGFVPDGTITYDFYGNNNCDGKAESSETVALGSESSATSALGAGTYGYIASYSGDNNYNESTGVCEPFSVDKGQLGIETTVHDSDHNPTTSFSLGSTVHDLADVSGIVEGFSVPNVDFTFYTNESCEGGSSAGSVAVVAGVAHPSDPEGPLAAGSYSFKASIAGNDNYVGTTSACEPLTVEQGGSELTTTLHKADESTVTVGGSVPLSTVMHDLATVNVSGSFAPTGNVSFTFYNNSECLREGSGMGTVVLDGSNPGVAHPSDSTSALAAGDYSFRASWPGDNNYTGGTSTCENFTVSKAGTETTTEVHDSKHNDITNGSVPLGTEVHDSAIVGTQVGDLPITGTVTYHFYLTNDCTGDSRDEPVAVGTESFPQTLGAGSYSYNAEYGGDDNYNASEGTCEPFNVNKADTEVSTEVHDSDHADITGSAVDPGTAIHDSATVSGQVDDATLGGSLIYHFFTNGSCSGEPLDNEEVKVGEESSVKDNLGPGQYSYLAEYSGDDNYNSSIGVCEPFTIATPGISISKSNDKGSGVGQNDTITYTLTVTNTGNVTLFNVDVTDVLPGGFTYVPSSTTGATTADPGIIGSVLTWNNVGDLAGGTSLTISYQAKTPADLADGTYQNFATCTALTRRQQEIDCNVADSTVSRGTSPSYGGNLTPQVLGISTVLPATGSPTALLIIALGALGAGFILKKRYEKN